MGFANNNNTNSDNDNGNNNNTNNNNSNNNDNDNDNDNNNDNDSDNGDVCYRKKYGHWNFMLWPFWMVGRLLSDLNNPQTIGEIAQWELIHHRIKKHGDLIW